MECDPVVCNHAWVWSVTMHSEYHYYPSPPSITYQSVAGPVPETA